MRAKLTWFLHSDSLQLSVARRLLDFQTCLVALQGPFILGSPVLAGALSCGINPASVLVEEKLLQSLTPTLPKRLTRPCVGGFVTSEEEPSNKGSLLTTSGMLSRLKDRNRHVNFGEQTDDRNLARCYPVIFSHLGQTAVKRPSHHLRRPSPDLISLSKRTKPRGSFVNHMHCRT